MAAKAHPDAEARVSRRFFGPSPYLQRHCFGTLSGWIGSGCGRSSNRAPQLKLNAGWACLSAGRWRRRIRPESAESEPSQVSPNRARIGAETVC
jgi:hypothetical protein